MEGKIIFHGLSVSEFIHPGEEEAKNSVIRHPAFQKLIGAASDLNLTLYQTMVQGTYVRLTQQVSSRLYAILEEACRILDYPELPPIYLCHMREQLVMPFNGKPCYLVISDYVAETYDDEMLSYLFGNAITMIKAGHVELTTVAAYMRRSLVLLPVTVEFKRYLHLADATSDRGGLLTCQSLAAAARCHFDELGLPPRETGRLFQTDNEAEAYIRAYLKEVERENAKDGLVTSVASWWNNLNFVEAPAGRMLEDLYTWYCSGYQTLLSRYRG